MNEMITIPKDEYETLLDTIDDLTDALAIDEYRKNRQEGLPHEFMVRIIDGEAPISVYREWRGLSQSVLADKAGVNRVQLNDIENGRKTGSVATLKKLAATLAVDLDLIA